MSAVPAASVPRPAPTPTPITGPFWDALAEGTVLVQRCAVCGHAQHPPRGHCTRCWRRDPTWERVSGAGSIWTWTVVHRPGHPAFVRDAPYAVVIVELDEGPRMVAAWEGPWETLRVGLPVLVGARTAAEHTVVVACLRAQPAGGGNAG